MKKLKLLLLLLFTYFLSLGQIKELRKQILVGKEKNIYGIRNFSIDKQSNKYVFGEFENKLTISNITILSNSINSYYLSMFDKDDTLKWLLPIAETKNNKILGISNVATDSFYFATLLFKDTIYVNNTYFISKGDYDILLLVINNNGQIKSIKQIGSENYDGFNYRAMTVDNSNNVYFVGSFGTTNNTYSHLIIGLDTLISNKFCGFILKLNSDGEFIWAKSKGSITGGGYGNIYFYDNNLYAMGGALTKNILIDSLHINIPQDFTSNNFISKMDTNGNIKWAKFYGIKSNLGIFNNIDLVASKGNIYFTGSGFNADGDLINRFYFQNSNLPISTGISGISSSNWDYFITSYDTSGAFRWAKMSIGYSSENTSQLSVDTNNNLLVVGQCSDLILGNDTINGNVDAFVTSLDSNGNYIWSASVAGWGIEKGNGIATTTDGEIYIVGGTNSSDCYFGQDSVHVDSLPSMFLAKIVNATPVGFQSTQKEDILKVYPNPNNGIFEIELPSTDFTSLEITDMLGKIVYHQNKNLQQKEKINLSNLSNGLYVIQIKNKSKKIIQKINIIN